MKDDRRREWFSLVPRPRLALGGLAGIDNRLSFRRNFFCPGSHGPTHGLILSAFSPVGAPVAAGLDADPPGDFHSLGRGQDILPTGDLAGGDLLDCGCDADPVLQPVSD